MITFAYLLELCVCVFLIMLGTYFDKTMSPTLAGGVLSTYSNVVLVLLKLVEMFSPRRGKTTVMNTRLPRRNHRLHDLTHQSCRTRDLTRCTCDHTHDLTRRTAVIPVIIHSTILIVICMVIRVTIPLFIHVITLLMNIL